MQLHALTAPFNVIIHCNNDCAQGALALRADRAQRRVHRISLALDALAPLACEQRQ